MRERREERVVPIPIEVFDNLDEDLDRIELWTAALSCFQHPAPDYEPGSVMPDEREGTIRSVRNDPTDQTADITNQVKNAAKGFYGQARESPSQVADSAGKMARITASSVRDVVLNNIENQPYTVIAIALGLGWLLGRMHRPFSAFALLRK